MSRPRPCRCENYDPDGTYVAGTHCRLCHLYHHDERYHKLWGGTEAPPLAQQAANFAQAVVSHALGGWRRAPLALVEARLGVCKGCDQYFDGRCHKCGCGLKKKATWLEQSCPLGKWEGVDNNGVKNGDV